MLSYYTLLHYTGHLTHSFHSS